MLYSCITFVFPIVNKKMVRKWLQNIVNGLEEWLPWGLPLLLLDDAVWAWRGGRLSRAFHSQDLVWAQAGLEWLQEWLWWTEGQGPGPDTMPPLLLEAQM